MKILVWNAQDWKDGKTMSVASQTRGAALAGMLDDHEPDIIVLLETGTAGSPNKYISTYVQWSKHGKKYDGGQADLSDYKTVNDKGMMYLYKSTLDVTASVAPIGEKERRPVLGLRVEEPMGETYTLSFIHAIANSTASAQQMVELLILLKQWGVQFLAGDMNHEPPDHGSHGTHSMGLRARKPAYEIVSTGSATHYSSTHNSYAELDWAYSAVACTVSRVDTTSYGGKTVHVWKGVTGDGASDHAAMLYDLG